MRAKILNRYILKEIFPSFLINILVFTSILLLARIMELTNLVITKGVSASSVINILLLIMPKVLSMTIPMSALLAVLTTFLRLSADSELTVFRASGLSIYQLLVPVLVFAVTVTTLAGICTVKLAPESNWKFKIEVLTLVKARADLAIREQGFITAFPGLVLYVGHLPVNSDVLKQVFINDRRNEGENTVISAKTGQLGIDQENGLLLFHLQDGVIDQIFKDKDESNSIFFDSYELKINPGSEFATDDYSSNLAKGRSETATNELKTKALELKGNKPKEAKVYLLEWHRRWAFTYAAFIMSLIGLPLGASFITKGRNIGVIIALFVFVVYYIIFSFGWSLGETKNIPPFLAIWTNNIILTIAAIYLFIKTNKGFSINPNYLLKNIKNIFTKNKL